MSLVLNMYFGKFCVNMHLFDEFNKSKQISSKLFIFFVFGNLTLGVLCLSVSSFFV